MAPKFSENICTPGKEGNIKIRVKEIDLKMSTEYVRVKMEIGGRQRSVPASVTSREFN